MNSLVEKGKRLPFEAKALGTNSYTEFVNEYPIVEKVDPEQWDLIITIAAIFIGASQLNHENISEDEKGVILDAITESAIELYPDSIDACEDCREFIDRTYDGLKGEQTYKDSTQFIFSDSLGIWVVWNMFGHTPSSEDERKLVRALGAYLVHTFISWWK